MNLLFLLIGLTLLVLGAEIVVRGSVSLGKKINVSLFAIGVVIVAGGTSLPELASAINAVVNKHSDLAVGAPGSSLFERLFFGVPSVLVPQNNIHKILTKNWVSKGVVLSAKNDSKSILKNVRLLLENQEECKKMSILGKKIVDGKGAERVSNVIKSIIEV